jgi:hypothetical protein
MMADRLWYVVWDGGMAWYVWWYVWVSDGGYLWYITVSMCILNRGRIIGMFVKILFLLLVSQYYIV